MAVAPSPSGAISGDSFDAGQILLALSSFVAPTRVTGANPCEPWPACVTMSPPTFPNSSGAFPNITPGTTTPAPSPSTTGDTCKAGCYSRFGITCLPALEGTPLECACIKACKLDPAAAAASGGLLGGGAASLIVIVVGIVLVLIAVSLIVK